MSAAQQATGPHGHLAPPLPPLANAPSEKITNFSQLIHFLDTQCVPTMHPDVPQIWLTPLLGNLESYPFEACKPAQRATLADQERQLEKQVLGNLEWTGTHMRQKGLALLFMLARRFSLPLTQEDQPASLIDVAKQVAMEANPHELAFWEGKVTEVAQGVVRLAYACGRFHEILPILYRFLDVVSLQGRKFTPLHYIVIEECLKQGHGPGAEYILSHKFCQISPSSKHVHFLGYHYLGALVYMAQRKWEAARGLLEIVVTAPGSAASAIQVAAHKKLVLINLILKGDAYTYPRYISSAVEKAIKSYAGPYTDLVYAFSALDVAKVQEIASTKAEVWEKDGNYPLLMLVIDTLPEKRLLRLMKVYGKLSLSAVSDNISTGERMSEEAVEMLVQSMVQRGLLHASVTQASGSSPAFLTFLEEPQQYNSKEILDTLARLTVSAEQAAKQFAYHDRQLALNPKWIKQGVRNEQAPTHDVSGGVSTSKAPMKGAGSNWADTGF